MNKKFYITTPIYYVNAKPHIGHAYTTIAADVLARFYRQQLGEENVFFLTGTDEHGLKIQREAEKTGKSPQEFTDEIVGEFKNLWKKLDIKYDNFIRTTDENHKKAVQKVLQTLYDKGAVYKGEYEGLYCVGCEQFKNESELIDGKCPDHGTVPELIKEESYLLKLTEIQPELIKKIETDEFKITPEKYKKEILSFLKSQTLRDVSISRKNVSWGIPLPFDPAHTTYVWVDAFLNYLTGLNWNGDEKNIPEFWPANVQLIGKDILRVHATIWPAILMHLGIKLPEILFTHGHILSGGKKMSKTLGNTISIDEMLEKFGIDGTRYLLLSAGTFGKDVDVTIERLVEKYNADLANGFGNLLSRVIKLYPEVDFKLSEIEIKTRKLDSIIEYLKKIDIARVLVYASVLVKDNNKYIEDNKPWELVKNNKEKFNEVMKNLVLSLYKIQEIIIPFMPETSEKIKKALETKELVALFPRIK